LPIDQFRSTGTTRPREEWDVEIKCPEHGEKMDCVTVNGTTIDFCPKCFGVWLDGGEIEAVLGWGVSNEQLPQPFSTAVGQSAWSEVDLLSPLIDALLSALYPH
jgi:Zn-finger nucleic acid-binding protein